MSRRFSRISLALVFLLSSEVWALGLGDIRMNSALNEPLNAQIELLSATPDELDNLAVALASAETFNRYGIDRPFYLQGMQFNIVRTGRADGNYVQVRSVTPMAEPFLTFLVEASWTRGRLLREYTVFLDPPTFAPPAADTAPALQAPSRAAPSDSGRIERPAPAPQQARPTPAPAPRQEAPTVAQDQPRTQPIQDSTPFDTVAGGDYTVQRSETLWGIASRVRPDSRLTMNQMMLAIFEANPQAFGGNINILRAGANLRIPSADEVFRINRGEAFAEAQRQHAIWSGGGVAPAAVDDTTTRPSLTLVPPDDIVDDTDTAAPEPGFSAEPASREAEIGQRIAELEAADVPQQQSLIEIRDNELAALREELARIRGEVYEPPVADVAGDIMVDDADVDPFADVEPDDAEAVDDAATADTAPATDIIRTQPRSEPGFIDQAIEILKNWGAIISGAILLVGGALFWFMRRGSDDDDPDNWQPLDSDELSSSDLSATETLRAPTPDESIVVVEQESSMRVDMDETVDTPAFAAAAEPEFTTAPAADTTDATGQFGSLEDTFSSETAINLDQSDPIAEADFHMAYGLYDQAADLVNGALSLEPNNTDLLSKLCEIYFVWGNRDAFVDAAGRLNAAVGGDDNEDWNKIVIMGQQIAADDRLFAGASAGRTKAVDLSFEGGLDETGALDMEFGGDGDVADDFVDLGSPDDAETQALEGGDGVDFFFEDEDTEVATSDSVVDLDITREMSSTDETAEMPAPDSTVETPTIEQQFDVLATAELPSLDEAALGIAIESSGQSADATA
ncbi:MAG: hypothetical protein OEM63_11720, partial [Gammaproteobacteria bacterium]|nr:hypothetical protein [Gammaproteobacteria bacterium]